MKKRLLNVLMFMAVVSLSFVFVACGGDKDKTTVTDLTLEETAVLLANKDIIDLSVWSGVELTITIKAGATENDLAVNENVVMWYDNGGNVSFSTSLLGLKVFIQNDGETPTTYLNLGNVKLKDSQWLLKDKLPTIASGLGSMLDSIQNPTAEKIQGSINQISASIVDEVAIKCITYENGNKDIDMTVGSGLIDSLMNTKTDSMDVVLPSYDLDDAYYLPEPATNLPDITAKLRISLNDKGKLTAIEVTANTSNGGNSENAYEQVSLRLTGENEKITTPWNEFNASDYKLLDDFGEYLGGYLVNKFDPETENVPEETYLQYLLTDFRTCVEDYLEDKITLAEYQLLVQYIEFITSGGVVGMPTALLDKSTIDEVKNAVESYVDEIWSDFVASTEEEAAE
jgi:hypothetical protein